MTVPVLLYDRVSNDLGGALRGSMNDINSHVRLLLEETLNDDVLHDTLERGWTVRGHRLSEDGGTFEVGHDVVDRRCGGIRCIQGGGATVARVSALVMLPAGVAMLADDVNRKVSSQGDYCRIRGVEVECGC